VPKVLEVGNMRRVQLAQVNKTMELYEAQKAERAQARAELEVQEAQARAEQEAQARAQQEAEQAAIPEHARPGSDHCNTCHRILPSFEEREVERAATERLDGPDAEVKAALEGAREVGRCVACGEAWCECTARVDEPDLDDESYCDDHYAHEASYSRYDWRVEEWPMGDAPWGRRGDQGARG
jgi:membrane protein involved in colicin uptake